MNTARIITGALVAVLALAPAALHADSDANAPHPLYDDGGTLGWSSKLADAQVRAKEQRRLIFIEWGRES